MDRQTFVQSAAWAKLTPCPALAEALSQRLARLRANALPLLEPDLELPGIITPCPQETGAGTDAGETAPAKHRQDLPERPLLQDEVLQGAPAIRDGMVDLPRMPGH